MKIVYSIAREMRHTHSPFFARGTQMLHPQIRVYIIYRHTGHAVEVEHHGLAVLAGPACGKEGHRVHSRELPTLRRATSTMARPLSGGKQSSVR